MFYHHIPEAILHLWAHLQSIDGRQLVKILLKHETKTDHFLYFESYYCLSVEFWSNILEEKFVYII